MFLLSFGKISSNTNTRAGLLPKKCNKISAWRRDETKHSGQPKRKPSRWRSLLFVVAASKYLLFGLIKANICSINRNRPNSITWNLLIFNYESNADKLIHVLFECYTIYMHRYFHHFIDQFQAITSHSITLDARFHSKQSYFIFCFNESEITSCLSI